jgi:hypothetical protein
MANETELVYLVMLVIVILVIHLLLSVIGPQRDRKIRR